MKRWPAAECLHERTAAPVSIVNFQGGVVREQPEYCYDCGTYVHEPKSTGAE